MERAWHVQTNIKEGHMYLLISLRAGIISVLFIIVYPASYMWYLLAHRKPSARFIECINSEWTFRSAILWYNYEYRDCLDEGYYPPFQSLPNYMKLLRLLVIPGYPRRLAAQLSQTLTAVKVCSLTWRHCAQKIQEKGMWAVSIGYDSEKEKWICIIIMSGINLS